uniref:Transmembrane protein 9 n=2 Tax=Macrostomum lignano TaxID=282301 RepID=A0A1I8HJF3_9PLAT
MQSLAAPALLLALLLCLLAAAPASAQYEDSRCKCICPVDPGSGANGTSGNRRRIWITTVPFGECNCEKVVDPLPSKAAEFCLRCQCKSETRSTAIQKVVVVLVLCIIISLCLYMLFLSILHPLLVKARLYQPHVKLEEQPDQASLHSATPAAAAAASAGGSRPASTASSAGSQTSAQQVSSVVNRAVNRQERWTRAVEVQRDRVYAQHSMLN